MPPKEPEVVGPDRWPSRARSRWRISPAALLVVLGLSLALAGGFVIRAGTGEPRVRSVDTVDTNTESTPGSSPESPAPGPAPFGTASANPASANPAPATPASGTRASPGSASTRSVRTGVGAGTDGDAEQGPANAPPDGAAGRPTDGPTGPTSGDDTGSGQRVYVHVAGAVHHPGIVRLPPDSRVFEALRAAGGADADAQLSAVNLAAPVQDGQQLFVPTAKQAASGAGLGTSGGPVSAPGAHQGAAPPGAAPGTAGSSTDNGSGSTTGAPGPININTASLQALETLPGVGPVLGQRIIDWRVSHGPFASVAELDAVSGIGSKTMQTLSELVTV